jgi:hypothetical protein
MSSVTFPVDLGGDGNTYTDDSDPSTGLANGGHQTRFVPCLAGAVAMAESAADSANKSYRRNVLNNSSFEVWNDATGATSCTAAAKTAAAECWYVQPTGAAVTRARSATVRTGAMARYSIELVGASSVTNVLLGQRLEAADIPKLAREVTFQAYVYNGSGAAFQPSLLIGTPAATNDFTTVTNRLTQTLQSCANAAWTLVSHTVDISAYTNLANGLQVELQIPSGSLVSGDTVRVMEPMLCPGAVTSTFDFEPVSETEARCERFFEKSFLKGTAPAQNVGVDTGEFRFVAITAGATVQRGFFYFRTRKFVAPTVTGYNPAAANAQVRDASANVDCSSTSVVATEVGFKIGTTGNASTAIGNALALHWTANARLF